VSRDNTEMAERIGLLDPPKKLIYGLVGVLLVYVIFRSLVAAAGKSFWFDELLTLTVSSQGSWSAILSALRRLVDNHPPLFYLIEHLASGLTRNQEIALRLPSILAFPCTVICVFFYVKKHGGETVALLCAVFLLTTSVFQIYAVEARGYGMVMACIAFALVCYQRAPSLFWTVLLAISLALAVSLHYLAVLAIIPFGLAESVRFLTTRRFRWPMWAAFVAGALPLVPFWNLLALNKAYYGPHYWARFQFSLIPSTYGQLFLTNSEYGAGIAAVAIVGVLGTALWHRPAERMDTDSRGEARAEATLLFAFVAMPFIGYLFMTAAHSGLTPRYVLSAVIGVSLAFGYILSRARLGATALFAAFVFSAVGVHELHFWRGSGSQIRDVKSSGAAAGKLLEAAGHKDLPVVVPNGLTLMWLIHYASPPATDRLLYPKQDPLPSDEKWTDTVDRWMEVGSDYLPLQVSSYSQFTAAHKEFLLYVEDVNTPRDWLTLRLSREGWSMETVALDESRRIYLISRNGH
jgi:Dolichyl-phosphate-mannose-protein mannosyltransferase